MPPANESAESIDAQLTSLRSKISDLGQQIDVYRGKTAAALGGGVFTLLLAAGAFYDLVGQHESVWLMRGVTRQTLIVITVALAVVATLLLGVGLIRLQRRNASLDVKLDLMEQEYADLLELKRQGS